MEDTQKTDKERVCIFFQTRDELVKVEIPKVIFFKSDGNYTKVTFANGCETTVLTSLANIETLLDERLAGRVKPFIRIGKSFIVNTAYIFHINIPRQRLVLTDCINPTVYTLTIGREALKAIKQLYIEKSLWKL